VLPQATAYAMIGRRAVGAGNAAKLRQPQFPGDGNHRISQERRHAGKGRGDANHASTRTTHLYDRRGDEFSLG
jgi:hypothetical protein